MRAIVAVLSLLFFCFCLLCSTSDAIATSHVVINELDLDPPGEDRANERVELFNPTNQAIDVSGWQLFPTRNRVKNATILGGLIIEPQDYLVIQPTHQWLDNEWEIIILTDAAGNVIDVTTNATDTSDNDQSLQRFPNGQDTDSDADWVFQVSTRAVSNGGEPVTTTTTKSLVTTATT